MASGVINLDFKEIENLIKVMSSSNIDELEVTLKDASIKLKKNSNAASPLNAEKQVKVEEPENDIEKTEEVEAEDDYYTVTSPIVGTFYAAPSKDAEPYVTAGSKIKKGDALCIIEAMKLMNTIESEVGGEIVKVLVKDGEMVEYGQPIFKVKTV